MAGPPEPGLGVLWRTLAQYFAVRCRARPLLLVLRPLCCASASPLMLEPALDVDAALQSDSPKLRCCQSSDDGDSRDGWAGTATPSSLRGEKETSLSSAERRGPLHAGAESDSSDVGSAGSPREARRVLSNSCSRPVSLRALSSVGKAFVCTVAEPLLRVRSR